MDTLAKRVKSRRTALKMTQQELADKSGLKQPDISKIELGLILRTTELLGLARALNCDPDWLDTGDGSPDGNRNPYDFLPPDQRPFHWAMTLEEELEHIQGHHDGLPDLIERTELARRAYGREPFSSWRRKNISMVDNPEYPAIRRARFKLSAGASGFAVDYVEDDAAPIVFQREWFVKRGFAPEKLVAVRVANGSMEPGLYDGDTVVINTGDIALKDGEVFAFNYEGELVIKRLVRDAGQWWLASDNQDQRRYPRKICSEDVFCIGRIVHKQSERI